MKLIYNIFLNNNGKESDIPSLLCPKACKLLLVNIENPRPPVN